MITFPCAKINLGLNIVSKRKDGYHNLETVFYPIPLTDALEIKLMGDEFPSDVPCDLKITGNAVDCDEQNNLVVKAYNLLAADFRIPRIHAHLVKRIPSQAGLGGGSADAAFMIRCWTSVSASISVIRRWKDMLPSWAQTVPTSFLLTPKMVTLHAMQKVSAKN